MIEVQVKVWRDYAPAFEKCMEEHKEFRLKNLDCTNRHSLFYVATVETPFQWDLFNVLTQYGPLVDNSRTPWLMHDLQYEFGYKTEEAEKVPLKEPMIFFELECKTHDAAEIVNEILLDRHFQVSLGKKKSSRVRLVLQNGFEGLDQVKSYLADFGLKLRKLRNKNVWLVKGAI